MLVWDVWRSSIYCNDWLLPTHPLWPLQVSGHSFESWEGDTMGGNFSSIPGANGRSSSELWTLSVSLILPGDERASRPPDFSFLSFTRSLKEGRGARPQHYAFYFFFLKQDMPRVETHITCRQAGNNNFCSHDSTVSTLFPCPSFMQCLCCVAWQCCREPFQNDGVLGGRSK